MAFKNEKISEQEQEWVSKLVNYESIRAISRWVHRFGTLVRHWWTVDHARNAYFIPLGGRVPSGEGRLPYAVLILDGQLVVFNVIHHWNGNIQTGIDALYEIHNLIVPAPLEHRREEIKQLLREAYDEYARSNPLADGGTFANPNLTVRWNIKSVDIEFKPV